MVAGALHSCLARLRHVWICLIAIVLQAIQNLEMTRYTVLTGEPITIGLMRNRDGGKPWEYSGF